MNINKIVFLSIGVYLIICGIVYYILFNKHHKKNKVELNELVELITKFYSITTVSLIILGCGLYLFINAAIYRYDKEEVVRSILLGIFIISATVINYINYIKRALKDYDEELRAENKKRNIKIGEIIEIFILSILMLMPLIKIPVFMRLKDFKNELYIEIAKSVLISISSLFLLYNLNPLNIKGKIFRKKD